MESIFAIYDWRVFELESATSCKMPFFSIERLKKIYCWGSPPQPIRNCTGQSKLPTSGKWSADFGMVGIRHWDREATRYRVVNDSVLPWLVQCFNTLPCCCSMNLHRLWMLLRNKEFLRIWQNTSRIRRLSSFRTGSPLLNGSTILLR